MVILFISRHHPTASQLSELTRLFGNHELRADTSPFTDAADIKRRIVEQGAAEVVCIAPLSVLQKLLEFGVRPLTARMEKCQPDQAEVVTPGRRGTRYLKFKKFQRLTSIEMTYSEVSPTGDQTT